MARALLAYHIRGDAIRPDLTLLKRGDKFEKMIPVANMDFDHVPVVR